MRSSQEAKQLSSSRSKSDKSDAQARSVPHISISPRSPRSLDANKKDSSRLLSLFFEDVSYVQLFRSYQKSLLGFISGEDQSETDNYVKSLEILNQSKFKQVVLIEAIESIPAKLKLLEKEVLRLDHLIQLIHVANNLGRKSKQWIDTHEYVLTHYAAYLKELLENEQTNDKKEQLYLEYDLCIVLRTALLVRKKQGDIWDEPMFFNNINEQLVYATLQKPLYDPKLSWIKKSTLKKLWKNFYDKLNQRLVLKDLQENKRAATGIKDFQDQRYKQLIQKLNALLLKNPEQGWKQKLLYPQQEFSIKRFGGKVGNMVQGFFHLTSDFTKSRINTYEASHSSAMIGTTYFNMQKSNAVEEKTLCLDANYQSGTAGATADGYGHFMQDELNEEVHQAAYCGVKLAVRYANLYDNANNFFDDIPKLFRHAGVAVKYSFLHPESAATTSCVLTKVFNQNNHLQIVAAGVGDTMALVWDRSNKQTTVLIKPRQYERGGQFTPISVTESLKGHMLQLVQLKVSANSFILRMTDGAWELLKYKVTPKTMDSDAGLNYIDYELDTVELNKIFNEFDAKHPCGTANDLRAHLQQILFSELANRKEKLLHQISTIRQKLQIYTLSGSKTVDELLQWSEGNDKEFYSLLFQFIADRYDLQSTKNASLQELNQQLDKISIGDDIALHVEELEHLGASSLKLSH